MSFRRHNHLGGRVLAATLFLLSVLFAGVFGGGQGERSALAQSERWLPLSGTVATIAQTDLMDNPTAGGVKLASMPVNAQAKVLGGPFNDGWYWIHYNDIRAYANGKNLVVVDANYKPVPPPPTDYGYNNLWVGELSVRDVVHTGPGAETKAVKTWWVGRRVIVFEESRDVKGVSWFRVSDPPEAPQWVAASSVKKVFDVKYEGERFKGRWVNVNLSQQVATAYQDGVPVKVTLASTGKASTPTNLGAQRITWRVANTRMRGGTPGIDYYDLPNVPWTQYFNATGEALHGAYWHDNFGRPLSHGCVNLTIPIAKWFYEWGGVGMTVWVHN
jgi:hypothetical protein